MNINNASANLELRAKESDLYYQQKKEEAQSKADVHKNEFDGELQQLVELNQAKSKEFLNGAQKLMQSNGTGSLSKIANGGSVDLEDAADKIAEVQDQLNNRRQSMIANPMGSSDSAGLLSMLSDARSALI
ncbi:hypothetical protein [Ferrimonas aestuarii]|uniref:Uncharacterized protein n=1 Tax=Ferrimonas aestuarii TaxID=2569539 RepID=A0A4U1BR72_9GAMM|nr:hypothetical protein [Ferrimonas aestuarii]TKB57324.1 hypothetical protein FCL42_03335 [Ferrimonas aestuarii]